MILCIGPSTIVGTLTTAILGVMSPDSVKTYIGVNIEPYDTEQFDLHEPSGSFGIEYDMYTHIRLFAEHLSSPMQCDDHPGLNYAGFKFTAPLTDNVTAYSGLAVKSGQFDAKNTLKNPIVISGIEVGGNSIKLFTEYMHSAERLNNGRLYGGVKYIFN